MALPTLTVTSGIGTTVNTLPPGGQALGASSLPVVIASDQSAVPVSGTVTANFGTLGAAATAAKQPALGTAGASSADVLSMQGVAGGTPVPISGSITATTSATASAAPPTYSAGSQPLSVDLAGNLRTVVSGSITATTSGTASNAAPTYTAGSNPLSLDLSGNLRTVISGALATGSNVIGGVTQSGTWTVQPGNTANTTPWLTKLSDGTNAVAIKSASTAPVAIDTALVVAISPNSGPTDTVIKATATDRGGTITAGGTAQQLMAANAARRGYSVQNQSTGDIYINAMTTATIDYHSLKIPAGSLYETTSTHVGPGAVSIIGATTGQAYYAREF